MSPSASGVTENNMLRAKGTLFNLHVVKAI